MFKVPFEERDMLIQVAPEPFFFTLHYRSHPMILVRPARFDPDRAGDNLRQVWRAMAPKRVLRAFDAGRL